MQSKKLELWKRRRNSFQKSGLTRRLFCAKNHLKLSTLDYWFWRVRGLESAQGLVEVKPQGTPAMKSGLEVVVAGKYRLEIRHGFDRQLFRELVQALESL